ncbi:MAG: DUF47 family protein [Bacillota bacterium]|nr:DUF47 family protein [Bacillota bacterium]
MAKDKRGHFNYFEAFESMAKCSARAAEMLVRILSDFDPSKVKESMELMHTIEHEADQQHHILLEKLAREFITPIEREDIVTMGQELDEITDCIEDVLLRIYMFNIKLIPDEALQMAKIISQCCSALQVALSEFADFKKSTKIKDMIIEVNRLEESGDALYVEANRNLYTGSHDAITITSWTTTFTRLEKCCDACEHVANAMETIMMKNS